MSVRDFILSARTLRAAAIFQIIESASTLHPVRALLRVQAAVFARGHAERRRKRDAILQILFEEAGNGRCYTANQFAEAFEGKAGLGGERTIRDRLSALATQGYIKSVVSQR